MILDRHRKCGSYEIDGVPNDFSDALDGIKVSTHASRAVFEPYRNSWGTMVTLLTRRNSVAKETSMLTSGRFQWQTSPQGSTKYLQRIV